MTGHNRAGTLSSLIGCIALCVVFVEVKRVKSEESTKIHNKASKGRKK